MNLAGRAALSDESFPFEFGLPLPDAAVVNPSPHEPSIPCCLITRIFGRCGRG